MTNKKVNSISSELSLLDNPDIRHKIHNNEVYYSAVDAIGFLTDYIDPTGQWHDMQRRDKGLKEYIQLSANCQKLKLQSSDGKKYLTYCANEEGILRIVQSISSNKSEILKRWLARIGKQHLDDLRNPEKAMNRIMDSMIKKGRSEKWVNIRIKSILTRRQITDEWKNRGLKHTQYGILTNEIHSGTFSVNVREHEQILNLTTENLRDNLDDLQLALINIAELTTLKLHQTNDSQGFNELRRDAKEGSEIAGELRKKLESKLGISLIDSKLEPKLPNNNDK